VARIEQHHARAGCAASVRANVIREATMTIRSLSYNLTLQCGCVVYVSTHPITRIAHTRVIQTRGAQCRVRQHEAGSRLYLWELLPDPIYRPDPSWSDVIEDSR
jgi:hypothetical protein